MFAFTRPLYRGGELICRIASLPGRARASHVPIFHVQHSGSAGHIRAQGSAGWLHHPSAVLGSDEIVIGRQHCSAFQGTDFRSRLVQSGIDTLVITGIQTELCVASTCRAAVALGYDLILLSDVHCTFDWPVMTVDRIIAHHNHALGSGFVRLLPTGEIEFRTTREA
jgi:nicotinamidase-related amidase